MKWNFGNLSFLVMVFSSLLLTGCGGDDNTSDYAIGGTVSGLTGEGLVLQNNGGDDLSITSNGRFTFSTRLESGSSYTITIATQPTGQTCSVSNGSGTLEGHDVTNVLINCPLLTPNLNISVGGIRRVHFGWGDVGADHYKLMSNPDGNSGFSQVGENITATEVDVEIATHLTDWVNANYMLQACNGLDECVDSEPQYISSLMLELIGFQKPDPATGYNDYTPSGLNVYQYGFSVALSGDGTTLAVGGPGDRSLTTGIDTDPDTSGSRAGAVYVYLHDGDGWRLQSYIKASNTDNGDNFGHDLTLSEDGNRLAVGALHEASGATGVNGDETDNSVMSAGAVYVFERNNATWRQQAYIKSSDPVLDENFGSSLSISGDGNTLAVNGGNKVYLFQYDGTNWSQQTNIEPPGEAQSVSSELSSDGLTLAIGISEDETVYMYSLNNGTWIQRDAVTASNGEQSDAFGGSLALSATGDILVVGAYGESSSATGVNGDTTDNSAASAGAVYLFKRDANTWVQSTYLKASNTEANDYFGTGVALSGDGNHLVVGAPGEDSQARGINGDQMDNATADVASAGAVYVFNRDSTGWSQQAYVKAPNTDTGYNYVFTSACGTEPCWANADFGRSLGLSNDGSLLVVGADEEDSGDPDSQEDDSAPMSGAVYIY